MQRNRREHYDLTISVSSNLEIIKDKYNILKNLLLDDLFNKKYISIVPNADDLWDQIPVYQAWDNSWYITQAPSCPANYYGDKCDVFCEEPMGCAIGDDNTMLASKINSYKTKKCADTTDPGNARYCDSYLQWNPTNRAILMQQRTARFNDQIAAHNAALAAKLKSHQERINKLNELLVSANTSFSEIAPKFAESLKLINDDIIQLDNSIANNNAELARLKELAIAARIKELNDAHSAAIAANNLTLNGINVELAKVIDDFNILQAKVTLNSNYAKDLEAEYARLLAAKNKATAAASPAVPIGPVATPQANTTTATTAAPKPVTAATTTPASATATKPATTTPASATATKPATTTTTSTTDTSLAQKIKNIKQECTIL